MARRDVSQNDSAHGPHLVDTLMLAGFLAGFSVFLAIVTCQPSESTEPPLAVENAKVPVETSKAVPESTPELSLKTIKDLQARLRRKTASSAVPAVANPEAKPIPFEQVITGSLPAAVAEKPPFTPRAINNQFVVSNLPLQTELQLVNELNDSIPTVGLNLAQAEALVNVMRTKPPAVGNGGFLPKPTATVLTVLPDDMEDGLPFSQKANCKLDTPTGYQLEACSKHLHKVITQIGESVKRRYPTSHAARRDEVLSRSLGQDRKAQSPHAIPALMQILQVETTPVRQELIALLSENHTQEATKALVNRAIFDLSPEVRQEANQALRDRTRRDYRSELLEALRYPWAPAARHAAETLVAVQDKKAVPALIELLDAREPSLPFKDQNGEWKVRELVRLNHSQNCLLCHAPSRDEKDPVRGFVPLPRSQAYYGDRTTGVLVRADVTYLRQDFSVIHDTSNTSSRPNPQRFDYLVRTRKALPHDKLIAYGTVADPADAPSYPQREAVLFALQKLTGQNLGPNAEEWRRSQQLLAESW